MTGQLDVMELIRGADPVSADEVSEPDERDLLVMEEIVRSAIVPPRVDDTGRPGWWPLPGRLSGQAVALASFLAVVGVGLTLWLVSPGGPLREVATTSGPIGEITEIGSMWETAINEGDLDELIGLYANPVVHRSSLARQIAFGAEYTVTGCTATGSTVTCDWTASNELLTAIGVEQATGTMTFTIADGYIQTVNETATGPEWDRAQGFFAWAEEIHPELTTQITEDHGAAGDQLRTRLIGDWVALGIAAAWQQAINAGDLDRLTALHAETVRWVDTDLAGLRDFLAWRIGLNARYDLTDCVVGDHRVTCRWSTSDDFFNAAGVDSLAGNMTFVFENALITEMIDQPDPRSAADWERILGEFDAWVQETHPELMEPGRHGFVVFTGEAAPLHLRLVQEWMATR